MEGAGLDGEALHLQEDMACPTEEKAPKMLNGGQRWHCCEVMPALSSMSQPPKRGR